MRDVTPPPGLPDPQYVATIDGQPVTAEQAVTLTSWIAFPSGLCIPGWFLNASPERRAAAGFHWDGNAAVTPAWWPHA